MLTTTLHESEWLPELEADPLAGFEADGEGLDELDHEQFLDRIRAWGRRNPRLAGLAKIALDSGMSWGGGKLGGHLAGPRHRLAGHVGGAAAGAGLGSLLGNVLFPSHEDEFEDEFELNPVRKWYPDAALEHLGHLAAEADSEDEAAEAFLPLLPLLAAKILPLAAKAAPMLLKAGAKLAPKVGSFLVRHAPRVTRAVGNLARGLYRNPATRQLLRTVPTVARRAAADVARAFARGRRVTPQWMLRRFAAQAARVLRAPDRARAAVRRSVRLDRLLHRGAGPVPALAPAYVRRARRCRCGAPS